MKSIAKEKIIFFKQFSFSYLKFSKQQESSFVSCIIRLRYNHSLISKTLIMVDLIGFDIKLFRLKSNFLRVQAKTFLKFKGITEFNKCFKTESKVKDLLNLVKKNGLENIYDFFNFPVKFNLIKLQNLNHYLRDAIKSY